MNPKDILVVGDSWTCVVAGPGDPWPVVLGIPEENRQGIAGSTASEWASDGDGRLTRAVNTPASVVIVSLIGNDMRHAMEDGVITPEEDRDALVDYSYVLGALRSKAIIALGYANPFPDDITMSAHIEALNMRVAWALGGHGILADLREVLRADCFDGYDIHPNALGHQRIADGLKLVLL